jgi:tRNA-dihydrouridine synthase B
MFKIGNLNLKNRLVMAPMAGVTNLPFRIMVKKMGAGLVYTEMISAMGLIQRQKSTMGYLKNNEIEKPLAVQIFGCKAEVLARAAQIVIEAGADIVDINMGCPVKKVIKTGAGASLLRYPKRIEKILLKVRSSCDVPLTVKIRSGWSPSEGFDIKLVRIIEDSGVDAITIHPRFATQSYSGSADWNIITRIKENVKIPVIGNGDVCNPHDAIKMKKETGCDAVMIGRAAVGNPWIFKQILDLERGLPIGIPCVSDRRAFIMDHFSLLSDFMGEHRASLAMRGLLLSYTKGLPHSSRFRERITKIKDLESLTITMDEYFKVLKEREN